MNDCRPISELKFKETALFIKRPCKKSPYALSELIGHLVQMFNSTFVRCQWVKHENIEDFLDRLFYTGGEEVKNMLVVNGYWPD